MFSILLSAVAIGSQLPLGACISQEERAKLRLDKATASDPGARALRGVCGIAGKTDTQCLNTFFRDDGPRSTISMQATVNCMSQIEASEAQLSILTAAFNTNPSDMAKYGHSGSGGVNWVKDEKGYHTQDPSPSDIEIAAERGRERGELAAAYGWSATHMAVKIGYGGIDTLIPVLGLLEVGAGMADLLTATLGNQAAYEAVIGDMFEAHARKNPELYLTKEEITGDCYRHQKVCYDADGKEYFNNHYETSNTSPPSTIEPGPDDKFDPGNNKVDMNPILDGEFLLGCVWCQSQADTLLLADKDTSDVDPDGFWSEFSSLV